MLLAAGLATLQLMPLDSHVPAVEQMLSQRFNQPVRVANMRYTVYPEQQLRLERVSIGGVQQIVAESVTIPMMPWTLLSGTRDIDSALVTAVAVEPAGYALLPALAKGGGESALQLRQLRVQGVKLAATPFDVPMFDMTFSFGRNGALQKARMTDGKMTVDLTPKDNGVTLVIDVCEWQPPVGPRLQFSDLSVSVQADAQQATLSAIEGRVGGGRVKGAAKINWASSLRVEGEFNIENARLQELIPAYTREFSASGSLKANGSFVLQGKSVKTLFESSEAEPNFTIDIGELGNVDLVRAMQSPVPGGTRGGKTKFDTLTGSVSASNGRYAYRQLQLTSGPLNANGAFGIAADSSLSGRLNAELGSKGLVVARGGLNIIGAVRDPVLRP